MSEKDRIHAKIQHLAINDLGRVEVCFTRESYEKLLETIVQEAKDRERAAIKDFAEKVKFYTRTDGLGLFVSRQNCSRYLDNIDTLLQELGEK